MRKMGYRWHLRQVMATRGMFQTSDLVPLLAERGVQLSREQVYRLVTQTPQRLSLDTLAALCDILECSVGDLIEVEAQPTQVAKTVGGRRGGGSTARAEPPPGPRTVVRRPPGS
jgi:DNA-binding Xre family transcriptional regulator